MTLLQPGQMIGGYQIINQLGRGGMAIVYKAFQPSMERYVAIKVLSFQLMDSAEFIGRFHQEAKMIARLEHPNILPVYDYGESQGIPYLVMRLLEAGTLQDRLLRGLLELVEVDSIFSQLADALSYAHENGLIHRDIKPSNAILDRRGTVFLTDFGIAKLVEGSPQFTATGAITGTPAYMSPEQAQGLKVDLRSDIYSLGIVLYEMVTGKVPFDAETPMAVIIKQIHEKLPPPSSIRPGLHPALEAVILKALMKRPEDRYANMPEFMAAWKEAYLRASRETAMETQHNGSLSVAIEGIKLPGDLPTEMDSPGLINRVEKPLEPGRAQLKASVESLPKERNFLRPKLTQIGIGVTILIIVLLSIIGVPWIKQILAPPVQIQSSVLATQTRTMTTSEPASVSAGWVSWAASNTFTSLSISGETIYASGPGGVTVWDKMDHTTSQITTADGLPSANITALAIDRAGLLWVGTDAGIARQTNDSWVIYDTSDGLDTEYISTMIFQGDTLWVGSQYSAPGYGLQRYQAGNWETLTSFPSSDEADSNHVSYNINQLLIDADGNLWVATQNGLAFFDGSNWQIYKVEQGLPNNDILSLYLDSDSKIWVGTRDGGAAYFDGESFQRLPDLREKEIYDITAILQDLNKVYWFVGYNIASYDRTNNDWKTYPNGINGLPEAEFISAILDNDDGVIYFGTQYQGLVRFDDQFLNLKVPNVPSYINYTQILKAPNGNLLFIDENRGPDVFDPATETWFMPSEAWPYYPFPRLFDRLGQLWGGDFYGLWIVSPDDITNITMEHGLPSDFVRTIALSPNGVAWVGTDQGLAVFDGSRISMIYNADNSSLLPDEIDRLLAATDGSIWVVQDTFVSHLDSGGQWVRYDTVELTGDSVYINDIAEDPVGAIWLATEGAGLMRLYGNTWTRIRSTDPGVGLPGDDILCITVALDGSLWFGLKKNGAVHLDGTNWTVYRDGLIHPSVTDIYVDDHESVWFTTPGGISRYSP